MARQNANSYLNGTAALKMPRWVQSPDEAAIIAFPSSRKVASEPARVLPDEGREAPPNPTVGLRRLLDSSEMYCSLKFESMRGVPYGLFTQKGIAALSAGAAAIGLASLVLGA